MMLKCDSPIPRPRHPLKSGRPDLRDAPRTDDDIDLTQFAKRRHLHVSRFTLLQLYSELFGVNCKKLADKQLKQYIEKCRVEDRPGWGYLIGLETFVPPSDLSADELCSEAKSWLLGSEHTGKMDFDQHALAVVDRLIKPSKYEFHAVDFLSPGVTSYLKGIKLIPNKTARTLVEWSDISQYLTKQPEVFYRPFIKRERGKARVVVSASDGCFFSQVPVARCVERGYSNDGLHYLFGLETPEQQEAIINKFQALLRRGWFAHSIDYKSFDHLPSRTALYKTLCLLKSKCDFDFGYDWVESQLSGTVKIKGFKPFKHHSGVPSGWRLTSIVDSVINLCVAISVFGSEVPIAVMGDDCVVLTPAAVDPGLVARSFESHGAIINRFKSAFNANWFEFLKNVVDSDSVMGYPARAIPALFLRQGWQDYTYDDREFITSQFRSIKTLLQRGARDCDRLYSVLVHEFGYDARTWRNVLDTPARFGLGTTGMQTRHPTFVRVRVRGRSDVPLVTGLPELRQQALNDIYRSVGALTYTRFRFKGFLSNEVGIFPILSPTARKARLPTDDPDTVYLFKVWLRSRKGVQPPINVDHSKVWWTWNFGGWPSVECSSTAAKQHFEGVALAHNSRQGRSLFSLLCDATGQRLNALYRTLGSVQLPEFATG